MVPDIRGVFKVINSYGTILHLESHHRMPLGKAEWQEKEFSKSGHAGEDQPQSRKHRIKIQWQLSSLFGES